MRIQRGLVVVAMFGLVVVAVTRACSGRGREEPVARVVQLPLRGMGIAPVMTASAPPATKIAIAGRVSRRDGSGIAGAVVAVTPRAQRRGDQAAATVAIADAAGRWRVAAMPGAHVVTATASGFHPGERGVEAVVGGEVAIVLEAGGSTVFGRVVDVTGGAVAGARVTLQRDDDPVGDTANLVALAGADGRYAVSVGDGSYSAIASADGYAHDERGVEVRGLARVLDFGLAPGGTIRGQVIAADGTACADAYVTATAGVRREQSQTTTTVADGEGRFELAGVASGEVSIAAYGSRCASADATVVELGIGGHVDEVRVATAAAFTIRGTAVQRGSAEPIAGVRIEARHDDHHDPRHALVPTGRDGRFAIPGAIPGHYRLVATSGDHVHVELEAEVVDRDVDAIRIEMAAGRTIIGRIEPPEAARLAFDLPAGFEDVVMWNQLASLRARVQADGTFVVRGVPDGDVVIEATTAEGRSGQATLVIGGDRDGVVITTAARGVLEGRVVDTSGAPVPDAEVNAMWIIGEGGDFARATTTFDGSFRVFGIERDAISVGVRERDQLLVQPGHHELRPLVLPVDSRITLVVERARGAIRGRVVDHAGAAVADAWVVARGDDRRPAGEAVLTTGDGAFAIAGLDPARSYSIVADGPRGASETIAHGVGVGATVTLRLDPIAAFTVRVTEHGVPTAGYHLACGDDARGPVISEDVASTDGIRIVERMRPGPVQCTAHTATAVASASVTVAGPLRLELALVPWASLAGRVIGAPGRVHAAVYVGHWRSGWIAAGEDGAFVFAKVPPGEAKVQILRDDFYPIAGRNVTLHAGARAELRDIAITGSP